jgi:regulation of enolase protein 1 (concanavalin A-like superfamily)
VEWYNEPPVWKVEGNLITVQAAGKTDFWRKTHDGGIRDSGHFYAQTVSGDFEAEVTFTAGYRDLYDQAGLMVRADETTWLKCGIELFNGVQQASAVVTRDFSDWSVVPLRPTPPSIHFVVRRHGATVEVAYTLPGGEEALLRQATLSNAPALQVGIMCCAPTGDGFTARFEGLRIRELNG